MSDSKQQLYIHQFNEMMDALELVHINGAAHKEAQASNGARQPM
jgi:hypothetical protein